MQVEQRCYSSNYIQSKETGNMETKSTTKKQENMKIGKVKFCLNVDVRKEKEDSWLKATKTTNCVCQSPTKF